MVITVYNTDKAAESPPTPAPGSPRRPSRHAHLRLVDQELQSVDGVLRAPVRIRAVPRLSGRPLRYIGLQPLLPARLQIAKPSNGT
jgi:hypothetical protein